MSFFREVYSKIRQRVAGLTAPAYWLSTKIFLKGINIGSGSRWHRMFWRGLDQLDGERLHHKTKLAYANESVNCVYSSHFFEHIDNETAENLFREFYRILKKGGALRIVVPDFEEIKARLLAYDAEYFRNVGFVGRPEWESFGVEKNAVNFALHWFANYQNIPYVQSEKKSKPEVFYRGPPSLSEDIVRKKAKVLGTLEFGEWAISNIPEEYIGNGGHINTWTFRKFDQMLSRMGFSVRRLTIGASSDKDMARFDFEPDRGRVSMYVEAVKE